VLAIGDPLASVKPSPAALFRTGPQQVGISDYQFFIRLRRHHPGNSGGALVNMKAS